MFGETVTVTREGAPSGSYDEGGNPVLAAATTFDVENVAVAPLTAEDSTELFGAVNAGGFTLYLPAGTDLRSTDRVTVRGESGFQVQGDAGTVDWRSPYTGWNPGQVAVVRRAS